MTATDKLAESVELYRKLVDGKVFDINELLARMLGLGRHEVSLQDFLFGHEKRKAVHMSIPGSIANHSGESSSKWRLSVTYEEGEGGGEPLATTLSGSALDEGGAGGVGGAESVKGAASLRDAKSMGDAAREGNASRVGNDARVGGASDKAATGEGASGIGGASNKEATEGSTSGIGGASGGPAALRRRQRPVVTYHHPCHLNRGQDVNWQPEALLELLPGHVYRRMPEADRCCGGGGSFTFMHSKVSEKIALEKVRSIESVEPDMVVTSCPLCRMQLADMINRHIGVRGKAAAEGEECAVSIPVTSPVELLLKDILRIVSVRESSDSKSPV